MLSSVPLISELAKHSANNDCSGPAKSSGFDCTITNDDFEDLQAGQDINQRQRFVVTEWSAKMIGADI